VVFKRTPVVATAAHDLLPDRMQPPPRFPLGLLHEPRRARVMGVSSAHHEELEGIWQLPRALTVPPDQDLAADARRRQLSRRVFQHLESTYHKHTIDRFASKKNNHLQRYNAKWRDGKAEAVDSLHLTDNAW